MGGSEDAVRAARRPTAGGDGVALDDDFWIEVECSCASAFGWTLDVIYDTLDLPTYLRYLEWWAKNPPLFRVPRAFLRTDGSASEAPRSVSHTVERPDADAPAHAGEFMHSFTRMMGGQARYVPKDYFAQRVAELDRNKEEWLNRRLRTTADDRRYEVTTTHG